MTTPDEALLWARKIMADYHEGDDVADAYKSGEMDNCCQELTDLAHGYRAGQSANAERVAVLEAENARLREVVIDALEIIEDQLPGEFSDWEGRAYKALENNL
jgi:hypothetical protein